jgi:hypothetical protein
MKIFNNNQNTGTGLTAFLPFGKSQPKSRKCGNSLRGRCADYVMGKIYKQVVKGAIPLLATAAFTYAFPAWVVYPTIAAVTLYRNAQNADAQKAAKFQSKQLLRGASLGLFGKTISSAIRAAELFTTPPPSLIYSLVTEPFATAPMPALQAALALTPIALHGISSAVMFYKSDPKLCCKFVPQPA